MDINMNIRILSLIICLNLCQGLSAAQPQVQASSWKPWIGPALFGATALSQIMVARHLKDYKWHQGYIQQRTSNITTYAQSHEYKRDNSVKNSSLWGVATWCTISVIPLAVYAWKWSDK